LLRALARHEGLRFAVSGRADDGPVSRAGSADFADQPCVAIREQTVKFDHLGNGRLVHQTPIVTFTLVEKVDEFRAIHAAPDRYFLVGRKRAKAGDCN
jgi:hypothetical protein